MRRTISLAASVCLLAAAAPQKRVDFKRDIAPILEARCFECHYPGTSSSGTQLKDRAELIQGGSVVPGKPLESFFYNSMADGWMPPAAKVPDTELALVHDWIAQGAPWPAGLVLKKIEKKEQPVVPPSAELDNVKRIRDLILAKKAADAVKPYKVTIPATTVSYDMTPVPGGDFQMGSPKPTESPEHKVHVDAFWMQTHEVTWDEFHLFMFAAQANEKLGADKTVDAISRPTHPYVEMSFGMGIEGYPAISMTQHAANKYAEWLSAKTGEFYRLPTEAEWEYACKAGGTDKAPLTDVAWDAANSSGKYQKVATKKPNNFGLYDMLGNVSEWTLDQLTPYPATPQNNPWIAPTKPYPISVRGGNWNDPPETLTCTSRLGSDASWKEQDPQLPKSIWYETDAPWLGFRLVRPAKLPTAEEMYHYWNSGVEHNEQ